MRSRLCRQIRFVIAGIFRFWRTDSLILPYWRIRSSNNSKLRFGRGCRSNRIIPQFSRVSGAGCVVACFLSYRNRAFFRQSVQALRTLFRIWRELSRKSLGIVPDELRIDAGFRSFSAAFRSFPGMWLRAFHVLIDARRASAIGPSFSLPSVPSRLGCEARTVAKAACTIITAPT